MVCGAEKGFYGSSPPEPGIDRCASRGADASNKADRQVLELCKQESITTDLTKKYCKGQRLVKANANANVSYGHVRSRCTRPCHGGYGRSRRARPSTAVHVGRVGVASSSLGLPHPSRPGRCGPVWMSVRPAMRSYTAHAVARLESLPVGSRVSEGADIFWGRRGIKSQLPGLDHGVPNPIE